MVAHVHPPDTAFAPFGIVLIFGLLALGAGVPVLGAAATVDDRTAVQSPAEVDAGLASVQEPPGASAVRNVPVEPDAVIIQATVREDGSAVWTVEYLVELTDEEEEASFADTRARIEDDPDHYRARYAEGLVETVDAARRDTGREMRIEDLSISTERRQLPRPTGVVVYEFTWQGFAAVEDEVVVAGDAIDRFFVDEGTTLKLSGPPEYEPTDVSPDADGRDDATVEWTGPTNFGDGEPRVTFEPASPIPVGVGPLALGGGLLIVVVAGWLLVRTRASGTRPAPDETVAAGSSRRSSPAGDTSAATVGSESAAGTGAPAGAGTVSAGGDVDDPGDLPPELLTNEERVLQTLEANGGRMKQQVLAEEHDWTDSKTSKVVGALREDDAVEVFRIGRENVLTLPEVSLKDEL